MRHLKKVTNWEYEEFSNFLANRFEQIESHTSQETIDSINLFQTKLRIKLKIRRSIHDISSGIIMEFPATIQIRSFQKHIVLELNINTNKILVISLIFFVLMAGVLSFETPFYFSAITGAAGGLILFALLYFKTEKGLREYADTLSKAEIKTEQISNH